MIFEMEGQDLHTVLKIVKKIKDFYSDTMEFSVLFFISFLIIPDVQFDFLSTHVHLANIFRKQSAMTPRFLDSSQS